MADVNTGDSGGSHGKHEKKRAKKSSTRIDMTPMVDLAFLLLTFFVLTSTFNKAKVMEIPMPDTKDKSEPQKINNAVTFLLSGDNKIYYYEGQFYPKNNVDGKPETTINPTAYSKDGLRKLLLDKNKITINELKKLEEQYKAKKFVNDSAYKFAVHKVQGRPSSDPLGPALTVLIKTDDKAVYKNVVDLIDEVKICDVGIYAIEDITKEELDLVLAANGGAAAPATGETKK